MEQGCPPGKNLRVPGGIQPKQICPASCLARHSTRPRHRGEDLGTATGWLSQQQRVCMPISTRKSEELLMISRRGFFGMIAGATVCPFFGQGFGGAAKLKTIPTTKTWEPNTEYRNGDRVTFSSGRTYEYYNRVFVWEYKPGIL